MGACTVRNADPFPRWPRWTVSLPTAGPKNHNSARLSLSLSPPPCSLLGGPPSAHTDRNPPILDLFCCIFGAVPLAHGAAVYHKQGLFSFIFNTWFLPLSSFDELRLKCGCYTFVFLMMQVGVIWFSFAQGGNVRRGSFAEDGCYFLCPSWSLGQRASADVESKDEEEMGNDGVRVKFEEEEGERRK